MDIDELYDDNGFGEDFTEDDHDSLFSGPVLNLYQTVPSDDWSYLPLTLDLISSSQTWQIGYIKDEDRLAIFTNSSKDNEEYWIIIPNDTTPEKLARKLYLEQWDKGYRPCNDELPDFLNKCKPMLATTLKVGNSKGTTIKNYPISVMRKLNGIRCLAYMSHNEIILRSREGKIWPHLNHIKQDLKIFFKYLPYNSQLDGEIYIHGKDLSELRSIHGCKKTKHQHHDQLQFWIFDIIESQSLVWEERYSLIVNAYIKYLEDENNNNTFKILQAYNINNKDELDNKLDQFLEEGYEGIIIRKYSSVDGIQRSIYKPGRNINLVKYKKLYHDELEITELDNKTIWAIDKNGNDYQLTNRKGLADPVTDFGQYITVSYTHTDNNKMINIKAIAVRDYE